MNSARYLNVDCILRSENSLTELLALLKDNTFLLWDQPSGNGSFVGFETNLVGTNGPEEDIAEFIRLFDSPPILEIINTCQEKVFDIGFESGDAGDPVDVALNPELVNKISHLGFSIKIRVYPVPPVEETVK